MISSLRHKHSISWTFSNNALAISAKKNCRRITLIKSAFRSRVVLHRDGGLNFTFSRENDGVLVPFLYQPPRSRSSRVSYLKVPIFNKEEAAVGLLEKSTVISHCGTDCEVQQLIGTKSMVIDALKKIHAKLIRRSRTISWTLVSRYLGNVNGS